ncbi:CRISPR-associated endonuclease Cas1 [Leptothermofonsia sichuanensis E412]|uniref:CRISPR-associated endonuclease Cas1 n=1 Tax=Leptothermofonsia sichuanensis TaxID=2917832 RepID=UPI001CA63F2A|nr:CRISPR-associated endonuclease Cas1 [Leptothermofonsia sichuanensis]QZZ21821.1 CRISPR-associated endonuclease Cas1 [Leptothermofonsia sichuanensis E412]
MTNPILEFLRADNFALSWNKVAANQGCAGIDGETIAQFSQDPERRLSVLRQQVAHGTYRPLPLRQIFIPKPRGGWRELQVPSVRDRIVQQALLNVLHPMFEPQFEGCSYAYRPGRSHKMAVERITAHQRRGYQWVLDADIVSYFDHIGHDRLLAEVAERLPVEGRQQKATQYPARAQRLQTWPSAEFVALVLHLVQQWLSVGVLTREGVYFPQRGIPQGAVISPLLANVYLDDFDEAIDGTKLKLVRYADDFVVLGRKQQHVQAAREQVSQLLGEMGLVLHPDKTHLTNFEKGFRFLGHVFSGDLVLPMKKVTGPRPPDETNVRLGSDLRLVHTDAPVQNTQMEQAMLAALKASDKPIPPPLFVVLGYRVREPERVEITSNETIWRTGMSTLYLVHQGTTVKKEQGRYVVKLPKEEALEIPVREVERVLVFGNIQLTTAVIAECLENQVPVVFMSQLGDYKGHLWSAEYDDIGTELVQYQHQGDEGFKLATARAIVAGKLANSRQLLLRLNRKRQLPAVAEAIAVLAESLESSVQADSLNSLRGYEGLAAAKYFRALGALIVNPAFTFTDRNRRPPKDPVNSLLSFGYTLLFNNVLSLLLAEGLNPYLGNLHGSEKKQTFLAFDLVEEFRSPVVDSLVMRLINQKFLKPTDFTWPNAEGGIYLNDAARRPFLKQFEERLSLKVSHPDVAEPVSYRRVMQLQVQRYKRALLEGVPYEAFRKVN